MWVNNPFSFANFSPPFFPKKIIADLPSPPRWWGWKLCVDHDWITMTVGLAFPSHCIYTWSWIPPTTSSFFFIFGGMFGSITVQVSSMLHGNLFPWPPHVRPLHAPIQVPGSVPSVLTWLFPVKSSSWCLFGKKTKRCIYKKEWPTTSNNFLSRFLHFE